MIPAARRRYIMLWQALLLALGTSWLWAPLLNPGLSDRISLISQYESPNEAYSWLFRIGDLAAGALAIYLSRLFIHKRNKPLGWLLLIAGAGMAFDPLLPTTCHQVAGICREYFSPQYALHAAETVVTAFAFFGLALYDAITRKNRVSLLFMIFQIAYGILFTTQFAEHLKFNTLTQYTYQVLLIVWLAWLGRDYLAGKKFELRQNENSIVRNVMAGWAFANGIAAILISLTHIQLIGRVKGLYFAGNSAWLAEHGVIVGVIMLYLSRHLERGESRARQIFLAVAGIEVLKYSVLTPNAGLLALYSATFIILFVFKDDFDRGNLTTGWSIRLKDLYIMLAGLLMSAGAALLVLDKDDKTSIVANRAFMHFWDYVTNGALAGHNHLKAALLAQTASAFLAAASIAILWILFKPYKLARSFAGDYGKAEKYLKKWSSSTEDFFKLWPADKEYFWSQHPQGFIAYKSAGPAVFALADPISEDKEVMLGKFVAWARSRRLRVCFLPIYKGEERPYKKTGLQLIEIGSSAVIDIEHFLKETSSDKWWRWQRNRAIKSGYTFRVSKPPHSGSLLRELKSVSDAWLATGGHAERGFALGYFDEGYLNKCRLYLLADDKGKVIAFSNGVPQIAQSATYTVDLLRHIPQYNNAMPFLLFKTIEHIAANNPDIKKFDLGFVPFAKAKGPLLAIAKALSAGRFSARGLEQFKNKFDPAWQLNFLAYDGDLADLALIALYIEQAMEQ